jgi:hypothetical protein
LPTTRSRIFMRDAVQWTVQASRNKIHALSVSTIGEFV